MDKIIIDIIQILPQEEIYALNKTDFSCGGISNFSRLFTSEDATTECLENIKRTAKMMDIEVLTRWHYPTSEQGKGVNENDD